MAGAQQADGAAQPAHAEDARAHQQAFCDWASAEARTRQILLWSPEVVAWAWGRAPYEGAILGEADALRSRLLVGIRYDLGDVYRAWTLGEQADAACTRYVAKAKFDEAARRAAQLGQRAALERKLGVLEDALPHAEKVVQGLKGAVAGKRASDRDLRAMQARLDALQMLIQQTRHELAALGDDAATSDASGEALRQLLDAYLRADAALEAARLRAEQPQPWQLALTAGYAADFGWHERAPVFAGAQFSFDLGQLWQPAHVERAARARQHWQEVRPDELSATYRDVVRTLRARQQAIGERVRIRGAILADLEERLERLGPLKSPEAVAYRNLAWFDYVELLAEVAADAHQLGAALGFLGASDPQEVADTPQDSELLAALMQREYTLTFEPQPLPAVKRPPTPQEALAQLKPVSPRDFYTVLGHAAPREGDANTFDIDMPKTRFSFPGSDGRAARVHFTYGGASESTAEFASGKFRSQIGLKLRARDSCNLLYVMWRVEPEQRIVVSKKANPGDNIHAKCGNQGYQDVAPTSITNPPLVQPGEAHVLGAYLEKSELYVFVDDKLVWKGDVGELGFDGPAGLRTDNGVFTQVSVYAAKRK